MRNLSLLLLALCGCTGSGLPGSTSSTGSTTGGGTTGATTGGNPTGKVCGGLKGLTCDSDEWCQFSASDACGGFDSTGHCQLRPQACPADYSPVCGCDNATYDNSCYANSRGVDVAYTGECELPPDLAQPRDLAQPPNNGTCGGFAGLACASDQYCAYSTGDACGGADGSGTCQARPQSCDDIYQPVCGCDGQTYGNSCMANQAGTDVASSGTCSDCRQTGCPSGKTCQLCWSHYACLDPNVVC